jgi:hypothetical protein
MLSNPGSSGRAADVAKENDYDSFAEAYAAENETSLPSAPPSSANR